MMRTSFSLSEHPARFSRREFTRRTLLTTAALGLPQFLRSGVLAANAQPGANDRIGIGFIGMGRQASALLRDLLRLPAARLVAVTDLHQERARKVAQEQGIAAVDDYRRLLERKDVEAIVTATPGHWHALVSIACCQAGKDVYCEKPLSLTVREGRLMAQAARKYNRVFQVGSQQRSVWINQKACEFLRTGGMGKISKVLYQNYASSWNMDLPGQPVPAGLDWNTWCGPVEPMPYHEDVFLPRAKPGWISLWPFSGGDFSDWGTHGLDMVQSALGMDDSGPVEVWVEGERFVPPTFKEPIKREDGNKVCSRPKVFFRYANGVVLEPSDDPKPPAFGGLFLTEKGTFRLDRGRIESDPEDLAMDLLRQRPRQQDDSHLKNWLDCIKSRARPNADVEIGHRSATVCQIASIARLLGRRLKWDPVNERFDGDAEANSHLDRKRRAPWTLPQSV